MSTIEQNLKKTISISCQLPYALMQDEETGKVIIVNRSYEALTICGHHLFDIDPKALGIEYVNTAGPRSHMTEQGDALVGTYYYLYSGFSPDYLTRTDMRKYLYALSKIARQISRTATVPHHKRNYPKAQQDELERKQQLITPHS